MDTPVVELPRSLCKGVECCRRPHEDTLQPDGKGFDGLGRCTGLSIDLDDVGSVSGAVVFSIARHRALLQLLDPLDLPLKAIADVDGERGIFGVENIPLWASFESLGVLLDEVLESIDPTVELLYLGLVIVLSLLDRLEQCPGDALQGVGVEVGTHVENVSCRSG